MSYLLGTIGLYADCVNSWINSSQRITGMATKTARLVPLGVFFFSWGMSEELGVLREDMGCGQPVVPGEKSEELWGDSLVSMYQPA